MSKLTEQFFDDPQRYRDKTRQRVYLKDIDCPDVWQDKVKDHIPSSLFYLNESTGEIGGPGALDGPGLRKGRGIARAGDLMSSLPPEMRAQNLMCYIGHEGTYTPSHREMCASLGQNIMVNASTTVGEDGKPERPGSSIWFMTEMKDRHLVSEYWLSTLGHDIEVENHFAQLIAWKKAPFRTYVVEQRPGDFILIPPLAPHQVWNRGTCTMKVAWNRTTVETLELALTEALPNSRIVCRDEQYKNKAIVYYTLLKYSSLLKSVRAQLDMGGDHAQAIQHSIKIRHVQRDFKRLFDLFKNIMLSEMFAPEAQQPREHPEFISFDGNVTCAYCRCNIFNRFLTCKSCMNLYSQEIEEPYDICMDCYCMGRSCGCQSGYTWTEQFKWKDLLHRYEEWRAQIVDLDGRITEKTPLPLQEERRYLTKKTLAQVCQEQLRTRPFVDIKNPHPANEESEEDEPRIDANGYPLSAKKKSKQWLAKHKSCHVCLHRHPKWKMAFCSNCDYAFCYGTLFRAHDLMPLTVMEDPAWKCPHCMRVCNTGKCRKDSRQISYEPKGTLLGHDTKKVADPRSVECLVDFSISNLNWMREEDLAMENRRAAAEREKLANPEFDDRYMDQDHGTVQNNNGVTYSSVNENGGFDDNMNGANGSGFPPAPPAMDNTFDTSYYPDPDGEIPRLGKRHRDDEDDGENGNSRKKKKKQKKKNDDTPQRLEPKSTSGKQYQKTVQRKLFEEAKRNDQFILVAALMKGKSKIVKLRLDSDLLEAIQNRPVLERPAPVRERESSDEPMGDSGNILESDLMATRKPAVDPVQKEKASKIFRVRVNDDEAYSTRKRNPEVDHPGMPVRPNRKRSRFEEITIDSEEEDFDNETMAGQGMSGAGRSTGRASNWLARKNEGEENLPTELPSDFRDGLMNPNREKKNLERKRARDAQIAEQCRSMHSKPSAEIHPTSTDRPRDPTSELPDEIAGAEDDGFGEEEDQPGDALLLVQSAAAALETQRIAQEEKERAAAAEREARENLRTKMGIMDEFLDDEKGSLDGFIDTLAAEDEPLANEKRDQVEPESSPAPERPGPLLRTSNSIFATPGVPGKNVKIVGKKTADTATTTPAAVVYPKVATFTSINKKAKSINVSDSESEDEIPARASSVVKKTPSKPAGRPGLKPTRGGGYGGRGRGRPRGRPRKVI